MSNAVPPPASAEETLAASPPDSRVGVVVIGRNEGERLRRCLDSLIQQGAGPLVYVDSGSTDGSREMAEGLGVWVEPLDTSIPFTMARGRNTGFRKLMELHPGLLWVQFVDGDCEVDGTWIQKGLELLQARPDVAAVCGFRRERFPEASAYNRLANLEWQGAVREIGACGGDAMYRASVFASSGGFNEAMIAGEEPELCVRLRKAGHKIWRLDEPMTLHDAAMTRATQWWKRGTRCGHAYAEGHALHGGAPFFHNRRALRSCLILGLGVPGAWLGSVAAASIAPPLAPLTTLVSLGAAGVYAKAALGAYSSRRALGNTAADARFFAAFCMLGKVPEARGALQFYLNQAFGRRSVLIEYKTPTPQGRS